MILYIPRLHPSIIPRARSGKVSEQLTATSEPDSHGAAEKNHDAAEGKVAMEKSRCHVLPVDSRGNVNNVIRGFGHLQRDGIGADNDMFCLENYLSRASGKSVALQRTRRGPRLAADFNCKSWW